ncbi:MAG: hypothetical protein ACRD3F_12220, partial [Acidobacteriaceae bacterium]
MAVLLVPTLSWFEGMAGMPLGSSARSFQASAQVVISGCNSPRGNKIIQKVCVDGNPYNVNGDLDQLESDAVNLYLKQHNLPASDTGLIYSEGREDLRNQIRGEMMNILTGIIAKPASQRTAHEQMLYNWLQALVQQDEIAEYGSALAEYQKWQNNPCNYTLDPTIAAQYGLSYNGPAMCEPQSAIAAGPPWVPAASYFTAVGLERSYGQAAQTTPNFASMVANTEIDAGTVWGTAVGVGAALGALSGLGVAATFTQLFPFAAAAAAPEIALGLAEAGLWATSGGILAGLGAGNIVFLNVVVGVVAAMQLASNQQQLNQLNNLQTLLTQAQNTLPDLNSFVNDTTGLGMLKLTEAFDSQTLPDVPSTAPLPAHNPDDPVFLITPAGGSATVENSFSYTDWNGISWKAETSGGWFDLTCLGDSSGKNCTQTDAFNASFQYVDWSGAQRTAWLYGSDTFAVTKNKPASTDTTCSNVTAATDLSTCSSYVANLIEYTYQGADYTLQLTNLPVFSGPTTFFFYWGGPRQDAMVTAGGTPAPTISLASGSSLPAGVYFNGGNGSAQFQFLGFDSGTRGTYQVTLQAKNANGIATQTFTIVIAAQLQITSPGSATFAYGLPASFLVTTTGAVTGLSISPGILFPGLTFHDNDNGTATISGTPTAAGKLPTICSVINGQPCPTLGITATDPFGSVTQPFSITVNPPPQPQFTVPGATFVAGEANSFTVTTTPT